MTTTPETEAHGPVDFVLLEFPMAVLTGRASEELIRLVEQGVIRPFDLLVVMKNEDGAVEVLELTDQAVPRRRSRTSTARSPGFSGTRKSRKRQKRSSPGASPR